MHEPGTPRRPGLVALGVVVPAHDEQQLIGACLTSVLRAVAEARTAVPALEVHVVVALDRCTDATGEVVRRLGVDTVDVDAGAVGAARRAGVARVAHRLRHLDPATALVAGTDADCVVPPTWLVDLLALAHDHDLVQGWVSPDLADLQGAARERWTSLNPVGRGSLHGANLAVRLDSYLAVGGFPAVAEHEDLLLVRALKARGCSSVDGTTVLTSGRRDGRVPGGFAGYLRDLDVELAAERPA